MYFYIYKGTNYIIYQDNKEIGGASQVPGERVYLRNEKELCKKRVYELNGWKWKD